MQVDSLRKLVQQTIAEEQQGQSLTVPINLHSCADLNAFVQQVLRWSEQPQVRADIEQGRLRFALTSADSVAIVQQAKSNDDGDAEVMTLTSGVITEAKVRQHANSSVRKLQLGPKVVLTPAAKDRLLAMNITIERLKS